MKFLPKRIGFFELGSAIAALAFLATLSNAIPGRAADGVRLTDSIKEHLVAAQPVRDDSGVNREIFDGKPVLVMFFASW